MDAHQVDRGPRAPADLLDRPVMPVQAANPHDPPVRLPLQLVTDRHASRRDRARHDRPMTGHRERPVDRHPEHALIVTRSDGGTKDTKRILELLQPLTGHRRGPHDRRILEKRPADQRPDFFLDQVEPGRVGQVALGQHDDPARQPEQAEDLEVFTRLGHDGVIGRDDEHGQVEPRRTGQHVADEPLVARHVDEREVIATQIERREAQVDGDSALFFGRQSVGIDAGQCANQGRLAVVDVSGRS